MRHPLITLIGYAIAITWAVFWGMVAGYSIELELRERKVTAPAPSQDSVPSPEVFRGIG